MAASRCKNAHSLGNAWELVFDAGSVDLSGKPVPIMEFEVSGNAADILIDPLHFTGGTTKASPTTDDNDDNFETVAAGATIQRSYDQSGASAGIFRVWARNNVTDSVAVLRMSPVLGRSKP